jgi:prophage regulatory protein
MYKELSLPDTGYVRLPTVLHHIPVSKSTWWEGIQKGRFPKPIKLSERCTAWCAEDIHALIKALRAPLQQDG